MDGYEHYDLQEEDPYLQPNSTCLINCLNIKETGKLNQAEQEVVSINLAELILEPILGEFDLPHLSAIHKALFSDIYPWAGQVRTTEISKGGQLFLPYQLIEKVASEIFSELYDENLLADCTQQELFALHGYAFEWSGVSGEQMAQACLAARQKEPDYQPLTKLLRLHIKVKP